MPTWLFQFVPDCKPIKRRRRAFSEPETPCFAATSPAYFNQKHGEEALCYWNWEANDNKAAFHFSFTAKIPLRRHAPEWTVSVLKARMTRTAPFRLGWPWLSGSRHTVRLHQAKLLCQGVLILFCGKAVIWDLAKKLPFTSQLAWEGMCNSSVIPFSCLYWFCMSTKKELGHYHTSLFFKLPLPLILKKPAF